MPDAFAVPPEDSVPAFWGDDAQEGGRHNKRPVRDWMCLITCQQMAVSKRTGTAVIFHVQMPEGLIDQFYERGKIKASDLPAGSLVHVRSPRLYDVKTGDEILQVTPPLEARVTKKLGGGSWRAENISSGEVFEFSEKTPNFVNAGADWPKVGAAITYHQSPTEKFAIMAKQKPYMLVQGDRYNMSLPHGAPVPTPDEIDRMEQTGKSPSERGVVSYVLGMLAGGAIMAAAPAIERAGRAVGLISHRYDRETGFYLPAGYGMKPE